MKTWSEMRTRDSIVVPVRMILPGDLLVFEAGATRLFIELKMITDKEDTMIEHTSLMTFTRNNVVFQKRETFVSTMKDFYEVVGYFREGKKSG